ncbi:helix-turn-helix domain-containing protein [Streptomyces sp. NPDC051976]|uniref:MmyB family transcriptional regulator n=1 Tax=Streptomyces sp. NPDC051976 TaxID=3154947 RepID=UPI003420557B
MQATPLPTAEGAREVGRLLKGWRGALDPEQVPGIHTLPPRRRPRTRLTQDDVALLTGVSGRWYSALEQGEQWRFSREFLDSVTRVLRLSEDQMAALYAAHGHEKPRRAKQLQEIDEPLVELIDSIPHGAYISDRAWDVLAVNELGKRHFPFLQMPNCNVMRWALSADAQWQLHDWRDSWATPMLAQLRMQAVRHPQDPHIAEVVHTVRQNPEVNLLWEDDLSAQVHPDGDVRPMWVPTYRKDRPVKMRILALAPLRDPDMRLIIMQPAEPVPSIQPS